MDQMALKACKCCQGKYQCPDCIYSFPTKEELKMHSYNHYNIVRQGENKDQRTRSRDV